ncbi:cupin domain-containing protein [Kitasatospora sp. NPDC059599]|uniref:cupin domain-containing protein n=1 Tax=Kitasatospora sp. NPDC059599 TaxID=3346880 RepID=UPI00367AEBFF
MSMTEEFTAALPEAEFKLRPSGAHLALLELPGGAQPVAPFTFAHIHVPPGVTTAADCHPEREVWFVRSGCGVLSVDGVERRVSAGEHFFYDSGHTHQLHNDGEEPIEVVSVWWLP